MAQLELPILGAMAALVVAGLGLSDRADAMEPAEEGTFSLQLPWSGTVEAVITSPDGDAFVYQFLGVATNQQGEGFLHNASMRCVGFGRTQGDAEQTRGSCVFIDPDGDQAFANWRDEGTVQLAEGEGELIGALENTRGSRAPTRTPR